MCQGTFFFIIIEKAEERLRDANDKIKKSWYDKRRERKDKKMNLFCRLYTKSYRQGKNYEL